MKTKHAFSLKITSWQLNSKLFTTNVLDECKWYLMLNYRK
jgi:hypothetical protein